MDPDYPIVLCVMEGVIAASDNPHEAKIVADLTRFFRNNLLNKNDVVYPINEDGETKFWKEGLFVVSPHHAQINRIKKELDKHKLNSKKCFFDTVDKMQGQETDVVIVSYGVSDPEQATSEGEFIFSKNRLNVSITRARKKTILIVSNYLFEPIIELFEKEELAEGLSFMLGMKHFMQLNSQVMRKQLLENSNIVINIFRK